MTSASAVSSVSRQPTTCPESICAPESNRRPQPTGPCKLLKRRHASQRIFESIGPCPRGASRLAKRSVVQALRGHKVIYSRILPMWGIARIRLIPLVGRADLNSRSPAHKSGGRQCRRPRGLDARNKNGFGAPVKCDPHSDVAWKVLIPRPLFPRQEDRVLGGQLQLCAHWCAIVDYRVLLR